MPDVCLEQNSRLLKGILASAMPSFGQRTEEKVSFVIRDLLIQYSLTVGVCTNSYSV
jgi:hypothetical protein